MKRAETTGQRFHPALVALGVLLLLYGVACKKTVQKPIKAKKASAAQTPKKVAGRDPAPGEMPLVAKPSRAAPKKPPKAVKGHPVPWGPEQGMANPFEGHPPLPKDFKPNWKVASITVFNPQELGSRIFTFKRGDGKNKPVYRVDGKLQTRDETKTKRLVVGIYTLYYSEQEVNKEHVHCDMVQNEAATRATFSCVGGTTNIRNIMKYTMKKSPGRLILKRLDPEKAKRDHGPLAMILEAQ